MLALQNALAYLNRYELSAQSAVFLHIICPCVESLHALAIYYIRTEIVTGFILSVLNLVNSKRFIFASL